ncbi:MAG: hypothetical protein L3J43_03870 [Sulfurovum sp.]|nr:hypothetical protein [Sulfurovum sp.]
MYKISFTSVSGQSIYAFVLMIIYIIVYLNTPYVGESAPIQRYTYIFTYFPLLMYYMILFPDSVLIPSKAFFPNLSDSLAMKANSIFAWVGLLLMLFLLLGLHFFYKNTL